MSNLKSWREAAGLQRYELATALGVTPGAVGHYEAGRRTPDLDMCRRIVAALNATGKVVVGIDDVFPPVAATG